MGQAVAGSRREHGRRRRAGARREDRVFVELARAELCQAWRKLPRSELFGIDRDLLLRAIA